jgi:hypothetical protein
VVQLDLDVRNTHNEPVSVSTSEEDRHLAHALILATLKRRGFNLNALPKSVVNELYELVERPSLERFELIHRDVRFNGEDTRWRPDADLTDAERAVWSKILAAEGVFDLLLGLTDHYLFAIEIPLQGARTIVKFRYVEQWRMWIPNLFAQLGLAPTRLLVPTVGIGTAQREHTRVVAPEGTLVSRSYLTRDRDDRVERVPIGDYGYTQGSERAVIYTSGLPRDNYRIAVRVRPVLGIFFVPAFFSTLLLTALLAAGWILEELDCRLSRAESNADAAVAILILVPSLTSIFFSRPGEHHLVARLHLLPRLLVLFGAVCATMVAAAVAISAAHETMIDALSIATWVNGSLCAYLGLTVIVGGIRDLVPAKSWFPAKVR